MTDESEQAASSAGNTSPSNTEGAGAGLGDTDVGATVSKPEGGKTSLSSKDVGTPAAASQVEPGTGPGDKDVGAIGIVVLTFYLIAAILLCFYGLIALWPGPSPSGQVPPGKTEVTPTPSLTLSVTPSSDSVMQSPSATSAAVSTPTPAPKATRSFITIFGRKFEIWDEVRLLLIVILAGALGSLVHTVRSVYWYIGNRTLKWSWLAKYILQPFAGSALAVIFYVVVRGGFFSPQTTFENTSPFGFAALAALVGLFSEQAVLKLKRVAETVLERPTPGANATPQDEDSEGSPDDTTKADTQ